MNNTHIERTKEFERLYKLEEDTIHKIDERIDQREKQIERLKKKRKRAYKIIPNWTEFILRPLIEELKGLLPNVEFEDNERYIPMGLCSRVSIFPKYKDKTIMLCIVPMDITKGEIAYETDKQIESFPKGTIGEINGMGEETIIITSAKQVAFYLIKKYNIEMKLQWCSFYEFHEKLQNVGILQKDALCKDYPDKPGFNNSVIELYLDRDIFFSGDIVMLEDENSYLYLYRNLSPKKDSHGNYICTTKCFSSNPNNFISPKLLKKGCKIINKTP